MKIRKEKKEAVSTALLKLDSIVNQYKQWQEVFDHAENKKCQLLANCLATYLYIKSNSVETYLIKHMTTELQNSGVKVQKNSRVLTLIVRFVFKNDRNTAWRYSRVLNAALENGIKPDDLVPWINTFGGINEVVVTKGVTDATLKKRQAIEAKTEEVKNILNKACDNPLTIFPCTPLVKDTETSEYVMLIGKLSPNDLGTKVLSIVPNSAAMSDQAIKKIAQALVDDPSRSIYSNDQLNLEFLTIDGLAELFGEKDPEDEDYWDEDEDEDEEYFDENIPSTVKSVELFKFY